MAYFKAFHWAIISSINILLWKSLYFLMKTWVKFFCMSWLTREFFVVCHLRPVFWHVLMMHCINWDFLWGKIALSTVDDTWLFFLTQCVCTITTMSKNASEITLQKYDNLNSMKLWKEKLLNTMPYFWNIKFKIFFIYCLSNSGYVT